MAEPRLLASPETRAQLDHLIEDLPKWAQHDTLIFSRNDIIDNVQATGGRLLLKSLPEVPSYAGMDETIMVLGMQKNNLMLAFDRASKKLDPDMKMVDAVLDGKFGPGTALVSLRTLAASAVIGSPMAAVIGNKSVEESGPNARCIIAAPALNMNAKDAMSMLTGVPAEALKNVPSDGKTWRDFMMYHEGYHCKDMTPNKLGAGGTLSFEADADRAALIKSFQSAANPEEGEKFVKAVIGARALSVMQTLTDHDHMTGAFLSVHETETGPHPAAASHYDGGAGAAEFARITGGRIMKDYHLHSMDEAQTLVRGQPEMFYGAVEQLAKEGAYKGNPVAGTYASQFLKAAQTYAPEYFKVGQPVSSPPKL